MLVLQQKIYYNSNLAIIYTFQLTVLKQLCKCQSHKNSIQHTKSIFSLIGILSFRKVLICVMLPVLLNTRVVSYFTRSLITDNSHFTLIQKSRNTQEDPKRLSLSYVNTLQSIYFEGNSVFSQCALSLMTSAKSQKGNYSRILS